MPMMAPMRKPGDGSAANSSNYVSRFDIAAAAMKA